MDKIVENSDQILCCFIYHSSGPDGRAFALHADYQGSTFGRDRPKSLEQAVTVPIPNLATDVSGMGPQGCDMLKDLNDQWP